MSKVIILGAGRGLLFANLIRLTPSLHEHEILAIVEVKKENHGKLRERLNQFELHHTAICSTAEEALDRFPQADAVLIVTPNTTHADYLELVLSRGKHAFLEKPVAADWKDAVRIAHLAATSDRIIQLGFVLHYSPFYSKIKEIVDSGMLGTLVNMQFTIRRGLDTEFMRGWRRKTANTGGLLNEKSSHDLDVIHWLKGGQAEPVEVFSYGGRQFFPREQEPFVHPLHCEDCKDDSCPFRFDPSVYDERIYNLSPDFPQLSKCIYRTDADLITDQNVLIKFADDTHCVFNLTAISGDETRTVAIHGTDGYLAGNLALGDIDVTDFRHRKTYHYNSRTDADLIDMHGGGDEPIMEEFFDCIQHNHAPKASVMDGVIASQLAFAADLSIRENRPIPLSELAL